MFPNRFALTLAAAARGRALNRGADPRIEKPAAASTELALREIGAGAFSAEELSLFLAPNSEPEYLAASTAREQLGRSDMPAPELAPAPLRQLAS
ncbi:DNA-directed RNA polymerase subunit omega [Sinorhizobium numidicum]|uniref:DNA-directed RNA polymerase subunit omega n=1 Tax=Sinorhizobium numidicum TaxID=680248 RepID=A0ABY8CPC0_9HYPH|nr:DNA-directed RNA polymerase subunit omega [Sinorhizobium numidicum]WEX74514.1 DNA-directed RNA polymerase subunit omega [Sinorhizobium numidicum]WEX80504.1 DNA-directed RNA polymerase subunit omega [Sinorhizobium numidicum]